MRVSIIIPTLNEERSIERTLQRCRQEKPFEIIVVDAGSTDRTVSIALKRAQVIHAKPGRANQMNAGAQTAKGDWLLFLHADTILPKGALKVTPQSDVAGFLLKFDNSHWMLRATSWYANNIRLKRGIVFGDHGLLIKKAFFNKLRGFAPICICEDWEFSRRARRQTKVTIIRKHVLTSSRRYERVGYFKLWLKNQIVKVLFLLRVKPHMIRLLYSGAHACE